MKLCKKQIQFLINTDRYPDSEKMEADGSCHLKMLNVDAYYTS